MARTYEPRISVRFTEAEFVAVERAAKVAGVATGALVRQCALRWGAVLAADICSRGEIKLRQRNGAKDSGAS